MLLGCDFLLIIFWKKKSQKITTQCQLFAMTCSTYIQTYLCEVLLTMALTIHYCIHTYIHTYKIIACYDFVYFLYCFFLLALLLFTTTNKQPYFYIVRRYAPTFLLLHEFLVKLFAVVPICYCLCSGNCCYYYCCFYSFNALFCC